MKPQEVETLFLASATETYERLRRDREKAPERIKIIFSYLEKHLFSSTLTARQMYEECGIHDRSISSFFHRKVGLSPWRYIESCRIEVGKKLVLEKGILLSRVASLLGYNSSKVFSNAFKRQTGFKPKSYQRNCRAENLEIDQEEVSNELELMIKMRKALAGKLDLADVERLIRILRDIYPDLEPSFVRINPNIRRYHL